MTTPMSMPPLPPSVTQQASPMASMVDGQVGANAGVASNRVQASEFMVGQMNLAAENFNSVAKVLAVEKPELLPLLQKVVQGAMILTKEIQAGMPQGDGPSGPGYPNQVAEEVPESAMGHITMS